MPKRPSRERIDTSRRGDGIDPIRVMPERSRGAGVVARIR
jgi:hypothetical protein